MLNDIYRTVIYVLCLSILLLPFSCQAAPPIAAVASLRYPVRRRMTHNDRRRRHRTSGSSYHSEHSLYFPNSSIATASIRRKDRTSPSTTHDATSIGAAAASPPDHVEGPPTQQQEEQQQQQQEHPVVTYADLGLLGKMVAGTVEITFTTLIEYATGFVGGYLLGTVTDVPRLFFRPLDPPSPPGSTFREFSGRLNRMHGKSFRWATSWGGISAAFGGFRVLAKVVRGGKEDEWSNILSSMAAGAYFARAEGPQAMLRGAVIYGGLVYMLSGGLRSKKEPFEYKEQPLEF